MTTVYGLKQISSQGADHAVVALHGIRQTRDDIEKPFARYLAGEAGTDACVFAYGYDHTQHLIRNGTDLAQALSGIAAKRIDLVGYSMGGLVARMAATDGTGPLVHTVLTLATPNRGSMSNAQLTTLGQLTKGIFNNLISPLSPRTNGVNDLTKVPELMRKRRELMDHSSVAPARRYASIPALFYNVDQSAFRFGPSIQMNATQMAIAAFNLRKRLIDMQKSHDGIVTENSNDITRQDTHEWSEFHLSIPGPNGEPSRCHAVVPHCANHDHCSVTTDLKVARLAWILLKENDWRMLCDPTSLYKNRLLARTSP